MQHARELPVVDDAADRPLAGAAAGRAKSGRSHTALALRTCRCRFEVLVQLLVLRLVGAERDRAVRPRAAGAAARPVLPVERQAERVVGAEREAVLEPALERRLDGVVGVPELRRVLVDVAEPAIRAQQVVGVGVGARHRARAERRVLVLRQVGGAEVDGVQVDDVCRPGGRRGGCSRGCRRRRRRATTPTGSAIWTPACHCHEAGTLASYWKVTSCGTAPGLEAAAERLPSCRCAGPPSSRSAGCPGSRTRCCRPDGRRRGRRRRGGSGSGCR